MKPSKLAEDLFFELNAEYDGFYGDILDKLDGVTIEGGERAYEVFAQLEYSDVWTYFWDGDSQYLLFPHSEEATIQGFKELAELYTMEFPDLEEEEYGEVTKGK